MTTCANGFHPEKDCPAHLETRAMLEGLRRDLQSEIEDRKRVDNIFVEELRKSVESVRTEARADTDRKCELMEKNVNMQMQLMKKEMDEFKKIMKDAHDNLKATTRLFIITSLTLWGTVIAMIVHLAEKIH